MALKGLLGRIKTGVTRGASNLKTGVTDKYSGWKEKREEAEGIREALEGERSAGIFHCEYCGKSLENKAKLESHEKMHCPTCGQFFNKKSKLENHQQTEHPVEYSKELAKKGQEGKRFEAIKGEYAKAEEFKQKGLDWGKKFLVGLFAFLTVLGSLLRITWVFVLFFIALIILTILFFKGYSRGIMIIILFFLGFVFIWMTYTGTGKIISASIGTTMPGGFEAMRYAAGPLNIFTQVISGTYDPSQIWNSKTYEDEYAPYTDVGVKVADVRSLRDSYLAGDDIYVIGRISAKSLPDDDKGSNINIGIGWTESDTKLGKWNSCEPSRVEQTQAYYSRFQCSCNGSICLGTVDEVETHTAEVKVEYSFTERGGKQIYVANYDELARLYMQQEDPVTHYGMTRAELASWQTEGPVGLGTGILGDEDVIATYGANNPNAYMLGISVTNNGIGDIKTIHNLEITMPCEITARLDLKESDFENSTTQPPKLSSLDLCVYSLKTAIRDGIFNGIFGPQTMGPQIAKTFYLPIIVKPEVLRGAAISSFFAKVDLTFVYIDKSDVAVTVRSKP